MQRVSVILSVFNAEEYLREAIDSILTQTFTDFEFLIINDGSTDSSEEIIRSYYDQRIIYLRNDVNKGLVYSLNRAIDLAKGELIARMDADDIALPQRLEKQVAYIKTTGAPVVATRFRLIDEKGNALPDWKDDVSTLSPAQIRRWLLKDNCLGHPTILAKASVLKKYRYRYSQKYSEDYDLWLRLEADGLQIHKIEEPLLLYRQLPTSATRFKKINVFLRLAKVKFRFAKHQLQRGKISGYVMAALVYAGFDVLKAVGKEIKSLLKK